MLEVLDIFIYKYQWEKFWSMLGMFQQEDTQQTVQQLKMQDKVEEVLLMIQCKLGKLYLYKQEQSQQQLSLALCSLVGCAHVDGLM